MNPASIEELQNVIRSQACIAPFGGGTKSGLAIQADGVTPVSSAGLSGMLEYQPQEYTFTALAGTPVAEVETMLSEHGQYLMFDPPLVQAGATLGGTVAAGLSGPGRYRYGGVRDALLGVRFVDGQGNLVRSGGKVVKNAAGFDLPKFMVGSLGSYGYLVELSFKVMPSPAAWVSLRVRYPTLEAGLEALVLLTRLPLEIYSLDIRTEETGSTVVVRLGGTADSLPARLGRVQAALNNIQVDILEGDKEQELWRAAVEFAWIPPGCSLVKVPLTPSRVLALDRELGAHGAKRVYSVGANLGWVAWPGEVDALDAILKQQELSGLVILGAAGKARLGLRNGESFARRVKQALDPNGKFPTL
jgi:glycolate oxidase FAD binding subunit